jgi:hypothetical protein
MANLDNRATLVTDNGLIDVERASASAANAATAAR